MADDRRQVQQYSTCFVEGCPCVETPEDRFSSGRYITPRSGTIGAFNITMQHDKPYRVLFRARLSNLWKAASSTSQLMLLPPLDSTHQFLRRITTQRHCNPKLQKPEHRIQHNRQERSSGPELTRQGGPARSQSPETPSLASCRGDSLHLRYPQPDARLSTFRVPTSEGVKWWAECMCNMFWQKGGYCTHVQRCDSLADSRGRKAKAIEPAHKFYFEKVDVADHGWYRLGSNA